MCKKFQSSIGVFKPILEMAFFIGSRKLPEISRKKIRKFTLKDDLLLLGSQTPFIVFNFCQG